MGGHLLDDLHHAKGGEALHGKPYVRAGFGHARSAERVKRGGRHPPAQGPYYRRPVKIAGRLARGKEDAGGRAGSSSAEQGQGRRGDRIGDPECQRQRRPALLPGDHRLAVTAHGMNETVQLERECIGLGRVKRNELHDVGQLLRDAGPPARHAGA